MIQMTCSQVSQVSMIQDIDHLASILITIDVVAMVEETLVASVEVVASAEVAASVEAVALAEVDFIPE